MFIPNLLLSLSLFFSASVISYTWPNPKLDLLEKLYYQQHGYDSLNFGAFVSTCNAGDNLGAGRTNSGEWVRTAYHDMATADVEAGTGGLDGSVAFELDRREHSGRGLFDALFFFSQFTTTASSLSDLIALGTVLSVEACTVSDKHGPVIVPFRAGRIDATGPGPLGVPEPHQDLKTHRDSFRRQGFNETEMITLVACGHSLGGVNGKDHPEIVPVMNNSANVDSKQHFDDTQSALDNHIAVQFLANNSQDALAVGPNETTRSDFRVFNSDGGSTLRKLALSNTFFLQECGRLFERMIDTVPKGVQLSEVIEPLEVKPDNIAIAVEADGKMIVQGDLRIRTDHSPTPNSRQVLIHLKPRDHSTAAPPAITATKIDASTTGQYPHSPRFEWWNFTTTLPLPQAPASFTVNVIDDDGKITTTHTNGVAGSFPLETDLIPQHSVSCVSAYMGRGYILNLTVAVRDEAHLHNVTLTLPVPVAQVGSTLAPRFERYTSVFQKTQTLGSTGYSLYTVELKAQPPKMSLGYLMWFGLSARSEKRDVEMPFILWRGYGTCPMAFD